MINNLIDSICICLDEEFDDYSIYTENVEQGIDPPCFLVTSLSPTFIPYLGDRYLFKGVISIQYFPFSEDKRSECNDVFERVLSCLEIIDISGDKVRLDNNVTNYFEDEILNITCSFSSFAYKVDYEDCYELMEDYDLYFD